MAEWLGNAASADWARRLHDGARKGYEAFWDEDRGSYVDHILDGQQQPAMSQAAGATAIVSGLAPPQRWARIIEVITDPKKVVIRSWIGGADGGYDLDKQLEQARGVYRIDWEVESQIVRAQPFFSYVVHDAVALAGAAERLPDLLRDWSVFLRDGYDTFGECWGWGTPVHAWSATPTRDLVQYVLGVTPGSPGFKSARIAPRPGLVARLKGSVPTPHGLIHVDVDRGVVRVDSPVPVTFVDENSTEHGLPAGTHEMRLHRTR